MKLNLMRMNEMFRKLTVLILLFAVLVLYGQDSFSKMYSDYEQHNFIQLKSDLSSVSQENQSTPEYRFFSAIFQKNGEEAKDVFQDVYENGSSRIKLMAAKKLMDYYYAKGYYINAAKYQEFMIDTGGDKDASDISDQVQKTINNESTPNQNAVDPDKYYIQVGAFSLEENARQLIKMLATQNITARVVERKVDDRNLYCVWLEGKEDFKKTYEYANVIKEKYDLKFRIIK